MSIQERTEAAAHQRRLQETELEMRGPKMNLFDLEGKIVEGHGLGVGYMEIFFTDGYMLRIDAEEPGPGGVSDVCATLSQYEREPTVEELKADNARLREELKQYTTGWPPPWL